MRSPTSSNPRLLAALAHARLGRSVLPVHSAFAGQCTCRRADCPSSGKHPISVLAPRGVKHATTSVVVIRAWWWHSPWANPAIATGDVSGISVLDVDGDKGGYESLATLERAAGPLPHTQRVQTASGEHLYFSYPGAHLRNTAGVLGPGLDVRCCGGYVVAVGAVHWTGVPYLWKQGCAPAHAAVAALPSWLLERLLPRPRVSSLRASSGYAEAVLASELKDLLGTTQGQRNTRLNLAAFRLARFVGSGALTRASVEEVLGNAAGEIGLSEREATATIHSGLRAGLARLPLAPTRIR